ncbi:hypothetical protein RvY_18722 [Ramazzottius varieornatus]|uniref:Uncharacterized protein n=1 Tax=Ramazzottius varieornatus TaxID=947166 RepID=A0A1D1W9U7_RAMVA|nr:hypothetical protein RvY_18722 [Ramazzottius varieornatus]
MALIGVANVVVEDSSSRLFALSLERESLLPSPGFRYPPLSPPCLPGIAPCSLCHAAQVAVNYKHFAAGSLNSASLTETCIKEKGGRGKTKLQS